MATCKDCIHYDICIFHLKGNENENCVHFKNTADVAPRSEVAREIFEEIAKYYCINKFGEVVVYRDAIDELKKKYTGGENNEV